VPRVNLPDGLVPPSSPRPRRTAGRRHGGAWKVAYADFVTALMALFIVLWMMNATAAVKKSIAGYFKDPKGYSHTLGAGPAQSGEGIRMSRETAGALRTHLQQALEQVPDFRELSDHVKFSVTGEGLRIDLLETEQGLFFVSGNPTPTAAGERLVGVLARELGAMPNRIVVEGHTDSRPFRNATPQAGYGNWELAADRANAARRLLHAYGVSPGQVAEVRSFADQQPFQPGAAEDARNRRISVVVRF